MTPIEVLSSIPPFARLSPDDLRALRDRLGEARFGAGELIVKKGESDSASLYIIEEGLVEISRGEGKSRVVLEVLGPGQYFGELALIDGETRSATATAKEPLHVLTLDRQIRVAQPARHGGTRCSL